MVKVKASPGSMEKVRARCVTMTWTETAMSGARMSGMVKRLGTMTAGTDRKVPAIGGKAVTGMRAVSSDKAHNSNKTVPSSNNNNKAVNSKVVHSNL